LTNGVTIASLETIKLRETNYELGTYQLPEHEELLILAKTYPSPSTKYRETTCVAAVNRAGELRRIFPVPFRLLEGQSQFQKWEWINANITKANGDIRPESHRIDVDTVSKTGEKIGTESSWANRLKWIEPHIMPSFEALEFRRQTTGQTLGFLRPTRLVSLDISVVKEAEWTEKDKENLRRDGLFDSEEVKKRLPLEKIGHDFYYQYECISDTGIELKRHKIIDWEAGALYRNCYRTNGSKWEQKFREKYETEFAQKDLLLMLGTMHRFPDQWLIIGVIYPPMRSIVHSVQELLDL